MNWVLMRRLIRYELNYRGGRELPEPETTELARLGSSEEWDMAVYIAADIRERVNLRRLRRSAEAMKKFTFKPWEAGLI